MGLTWALVIATYNRPKELKYCVECALLQTARPKELIIVDASEHWTESRDAIQGILDKKGCGIRLFYQPAKIKGQSAQRNQALTMATADVLFMFDDDTYMFKQCAERILAIYEVDTRFDVAGVKVSQAIARPGLNATDIADVGQSRQARNALRQFMAAANRRMVYALCGSFAPVISRPVPQPVKSLFPHTTSTTLLEGFCLSVRRCVAQKELFDAAILVNAHEDQEACLRFLRHGALVWLHEPLLFHARAPRSKDLDRQGQLYGAFWQLNHAYINVKLYSTDKSIRRRIRQANFGASIISLLHGAVRRNFSQYRGVRLAQSSVRRILRARNAGELVVYFSEETERLTRIINS